ncbi:hypothetical protein D3C84_1093550 [compost metagenome]
MKGDTTEATAQVGEVGHEQFAKPFHSVWCRWTAPADGTYSFDTSGSKFNTVLAIYESTSLNSMPVVGANRNRTSEDVTSLVRFVAEKDKTYSIAIDGVNGVSGKYFLNWVKESH